MKDRKGGTKRTWTEGHTDEILNKISKLKGNIAHTEEDPLHELDEFLENKTIPEDGFKLKELSEGDIIKLIRKLKGKKSCGLDWICGYSLKIAAIELVP